MVNDKILILAAGLLLATSAPAGAQMVGAVGNNPGQSPAEVRQVDQKFDELKNKGALNDPNVDAAKELELGAKLVKASQFEEAIPHLEIALAKRPNDVTTLIYLGFSHRMVGGKLHGLVRTDAFLKALGYYRRGLALDPNNKLLHEYIGKVLVLLDDIPAAQVEVKALQKLCPSGCDELKALSAVVPAS